MNQKGFIQIPLLIGIIVAIVIISVVGTGVVLHKQGKLAPLVANLSEVLKGDEEITIIEEKAGLEVSQEEASQQTCI